MRFVSLSIFIKLPSLFLFYSLPFFITALLVNLAVNVLNSDLLIQNGISCFFELRFYLFDVQGV